MTGYELKKFFDTSVAHFWNAELSQIYPALKAMESEGLVEMKVEVQNDRPNRKVYSITESGRRELVDKFVESLGLQHESLFWKLTVDCGLKIHTAELEWTHDAIRQIEAADGSFFEYGHTQDGEVEMRTESEIRVRA